MERLYVRFEIEGGLYEVETDPEMMFDYIEADPATIERIRNALPEAAWAARYIEQNKKLDEAAAARHAAEMREMNEQIRRRFGPPPL